MPDFEKMYFRLFNALTDILDALERGDIGAARELIRQAQCDGEELYLSSEE